MRTKLLVGVGVLIISVFLVLATFHENKSPATVLLHHGGMNGDFLINDVPGFRSRLVNDGSALCNGLEGILESDPGYMYGWPVSYMYQPDCFLGTFYPLAFIADVVCFMIPVSALVSLVYIGVTDRKHSPAGT